MQQLRAVVGRLGLTIPVVALVDVETRDSGVGWVKLGADDVIARNADLEEIVVRIKALLHGPARGAEAWPVPPARLVAAGNRLDYRRGVLEEWYVNSPRGLEQGFSLPAPPEEIAAQTNAASSKTTRPGRGRGIAPDDLVHLDLELSGDVDPVFSADGLAIDLRTGAGAFVVHFAERKVTDATGRDLPAWMEGFSLTPGRGIRLC